MVSQTNLLIENNRSCYYNREKVQVGNDQEKAQSEKKIPTPKTGVRKKKTNNKVLRP